MLCLLQYEIKNLTSTYSKHSKLSNLQIKPKRTADTWLVNQRALNHTSNIKVACGRVDRWLRPRTLPGSIPTPLPGPRDRWTRVFTAF